MFPLTLTYSPASAPHVSHFVVKDVVRLTGRRMGIGLLLSLTLMLAGTGVRGNWFDSEDMQLFDLVEEVNGTFYEFMSLNQVSPSVT